MSSNPVTIYQDEHEENELRRNMARIERELPSRQLHKVFQEYEVSASQVLQVVRFLCAHPQLQSVLLEAVPHISRVFGKWLTYLEVERDPHEGFEELFGVIKVNALPEEALDLLAQFDREWFTQVVRRSEGKLNFTVDTSTYERV